jgi:uridine kinase
MHLPLTSLLMGEAAGEADFAVRLVEDPHDVHVGDRAGEIGKEKESGELGEEGDRRRSVEQENGEAMEGYRVQVKTGIEELKFSRRRRDTLPAMEKRAWVVSPGESAGFSRRERLDAD